MKKLILLFIMIYIAASVGTQFNTESKEVKVKCEPTRFVVCPKV